MKYAAPEDVRKNITPYERTALGLQHLGVVVHDGVPFAQFEDMMRYKNTVRPNTATNLMRDKIMAFIEDNDVSLRCDGDCYAHLDQTVIGCYLELIEDTQSGDDL